jgi:pimeloyl-ACP methyl ester carboxylesterase
MPVSRYLAIAHGLAFALLAAAPSAHAARTLGQLQFEPCSLAAPGMPATVSAWCSSLEVPEDRSRPQARRIRLAVAWVPTSAKRARPDPVFMLAGGPGQSARESFPSVADAFGDVLRHRDVILVDQRGTGGSHALECRDSEGHSAVTEGNSDDPEVARSFAERCLRSLDADPRFYTTGDAVADLDAVRVAIGAQQVNLVGISYGTRVAQEYLRRHPATTRTVVLDGVVPAELALGSEHARNLEDAVDRQFARCTADPVCASRYGNPRQRLDELLARLRAQPLQVHFHDPLTNELREDSLTAESVAGVVRLYAYAPQLFAMLPLSLADAAAGHPEVFMAQASMLQSLIGEQIMHGLQLSVGCSEDADLLQPDPADRGTLLGTAFVGFLKAQCAVWPRGAVPKDFHDPVRSDRPVLLFSGELDPVTPPRYGEQVVKYLPNGRHLVLRGQGHNVIVAGCAPRLLGKFIASADARALDAKCLDQLIYTPPFTGTYGWEP